ncbi:Hus1-like protein [Aulographum hederae CBS 113979]|uniref:Checkpoint protein n=1 Tax=Aulographum hederae CBS 113979 TaxID=1176131 RepID=A0A6G1HAZ1_9PEZI|nr:Hus1-like protein [Aulographum hederae CBS 113979]
MRFKAGIQNINTFNKFTASLASLSPVAWVRLDETEVRFTVIPEQGTQVWSVLSIETIFEQYTIQSAADNVVNLEVPLPSLQRALKSALNATSANIRLTKKDGLPILCLTIVSTSNAPNQFSAFGSTASRDDGPSYDDSQISNVTDGLSRHRETIITQDIPVRVMSMANVQGIHEPRCREPDVYIVLPPLLQLKSISDRFTRLAMTSRASASGGGGTASSSSSGPKLEMSANMHGCLRLGIRTDAMNISSVWTKLSNPDLDPAVVEGGDEGVLQHPSTRMKELGDAEGRSEEGWATVRIDGRDWGKVMSVGRLAGRVIACFCHEHALILYVYLSNSDEDRDVSVLTYYVSSYSP